MIKVCHLTSAHDTEDDRIFVKECVSLAQNGYDVYLVEKGDTYDKHGVHMVGMGEVPNSRIRRMINGGRKTYFKALEVNADIYQIHDPELLPYALKLKKRGKIVLFDTHEDVPAQIIDKTWIIKPLRWLVSKLYRSYETYVVRRIDAVVAATPHIAKKFEGRAKRAMDINNFPRLDDIQFHETPFSEKDAIVCYAGGIDELRGEDIMIKAMHDVDGKLIIAGEHEVRDIPDVNVSYVGRLDRRGVNELYGKAIAGLCILRPTQNYYYSQPIKMYEYMAAGIPFICSNFPLWQKVANESGAGICIDPMDTSALSEQINNLLRNRDKAEQMGKNGHKYVIENCTWAIEEKKLVCLYKDLL